MFQEKSPLVIWKMVLPHNLIPSHFIIYCNLLNVVKMYLTKYATFNLIYHSNEETV